MLDENLTPERGELLRPRRPELEDAAMVARRRYDAMLPRNVTPTGDLSWPRLALNALVLVGLWTCDGLSAIGQRKRRR